MGGGITYLWTVGDVQTSKRPLNVWRPAGKWPGLFSVKTSWSVLYLLTKHHRAPEPGTGRGVTIMT